MILVRLLVALTMLRFCAVIVAAENTGALYIFAVGVEPQLTAKGLRDPYAGDALFVSKALSRAEHFYAQTHRRVLAGSEASRPAVLSGLNWLVESVKANDLAVVFFSAHADMQAGEGYAIGLAASKDAKDEPVLWGAELNESLGKIRGKTVLFLDTCCAGGVLQAGKGKAGRVGVLAACKADESSDGQWKRADRPHGWFVIALCEALGGMADGDHDGTVTFAEIAAYLAPRARNLYKQQNAVFDSASELGASPLARFDQTTKPILLWP